VPPRAARASADARAVLRAAYGRVVAAETVFAGEGARLVLRVAGPERDGDGAESWLAGEAHLSLRREGSAVEARCTVSFTADELAAFLAELERVLERRKGEALLVTLDDRLELRIRLARDGATIAGRLDDATAVCVEFGELPTDVFALDAALDGVGAIVRAFPVEV
jgi:hypothetical protein